MNVGGGESLIKPVNIKQNIQRGNVSVMISYPQTMGRLAKTHILLYMHMY